MQRTYFLKSLMDEKEREEGEGGGNGTGNKKGVVSDERDPFKNWKSFLEGCEEIAHRRPALG